MSNNDYDSVLYYIQWIETLDKKYCRIGKVDNDSIWVGVDIGYQSTCQSVINLIKMTFI